MEIQKLQKNDYKEIINLWNRSIDEQFIYKRLNEESYLNYFFRDNKDYQIVSFKAVKDGKIKGFVSGVIYETRKIFYITMILVDKKERRKGVGKRLYEEIENVWNDNKLIEKVEILFTNPVNLVWIVPFTKADEHPNSPGIDLKSEAYMFFKNFGFRDFAYQNSYYKKISNYEYSKNIIKRIEKAKKENIKTDFYNINKHEELEELMENLGSLSWKEEVLSHVKDKKEENTLLVALDKNKVIGFTGPIHKQDSGRGYFAGIGIHSDYRGKGLGTLLFSKLCMSFKEIGVRYMTLFTGKNNPARNIYERENFKIVRSWANMRKDIKK